MRILVAEDDRASRIMLSSMLSKWGYEPIAVEDGEQAWEVLSSEESPQLAILDWMMPAPDGLEICKKLRCKSLEFRQEVNGNQDCNFKGEYIYLILLTAKTERQDMIQGLEAGADDYITKPFNADELQARIRVGIRIIELQNQLLEIQNRLQYLARIDSLTNIYNRRAIIELLKNEISRSRRENTTFSLAIMDIDHFKRINDNYGHAIGDAVLRECTIRIRSVLRDYDFLGRFGGEEFLIIIPNTDFDQAVKICERIRYAINHKDYEYGEEKIKFTASFGLSAWNKEDDVDVLLKIVDDLLYQAKRKGRDRVECELD